MLIKSILRLINDLVTSCVFVTALQDFTVLPTAKFRRCVIRSSSVIFYRHHHRRNKSVGFTFVGDSSFCRYISRKNKKIIYRRFYRRNVRAKKKRFLLEIYRRIFIPSVKLKLPTENIRRYIGRWNWKYRRNISVCKFVGTGGSYC